MVEGFLLLAAIFTSICGMGWLALAMPPHWQQVRGDRPLAVTSVRLLRVLGGLALGASLLLCLWADHATMASIVWVMALTTAAFTIAFTLSWRPRWLAWLVVWL